MDTVVIVTEGLIVAPSDRAAKSDTVMSDRLSVPPAAGAPQNAYMFGTARKRGANNVSSCDEAVSRVVSICSRGALTQRRGGMAVRPPVGRESPACDTAVVGCAAGAIMSVAKGGTA